MYGQCMTGGCKVHCVSLADTRDYCEGVAAQHYRLPCTQGEAPHNQSMPARHESLPSLQLVLCRASDNSNADASRTEPESCHHAIAQCTLLQPNKLKDKLAKFFEEISSLVLYSHRSNIAMQCQHNCVSVLARAEFWSMHTSTLSATCDRAMS